MGEPTTTELRRGRHGVERFTRERPRRSIAFARLAFGIVDGRAPEAVAARDGAQRRLLMLADSLAALCALWFAVSGLGDDALRPAGLLVVPLVLVAARAMHLHHRDEVVLSKATLGEAPALLNVGVLCAFVTYVGQGAFIDGTLGPMQGLALCGAFFGTSLVVRSGVRRLAAAAGEPERCLVIAGVDEAIAVEEKLAAANVVSAEVLATIDPSQLSAGPEARAWITRVVQEQDVHRVILASPQIDDGELLALIRDMKAIGVKVSIKPRLLDVVGAAVEFDDVHGSMFLGVRRFGLSTGQQRVKRAFDVAGAVTLILLTAPLWVAIAALVKLDSRGPVFFRQVRIGRQGERFEMLKFRTMVADAEEQKAALRELNEAGELFKIADDPRVTRFGRLLRSTALDELPQLVNVLRRDMSLVGPRPLVVEEDQRVVGWHRRRLHLTPGMTGVWQVMGSARIPLQEMVALDHLYIVNWSLWQDIEILLRTVGFVAGRRGI